MRACPGQSATTSEGGGRRGGDTCWPNDLIKSAARSTWGAIPRRPWTGLRRLAQVPARVHGPTPAMNPLLCQPPDGEERMPRASGSAHTVVGPREAVGPGSSPTQRREQVTAPMLQYVAVVTDAPWVLVVRVGRGDGGGCGVRADHGEVYRPGGSRRAAGDRAGHGRGRDAGVGGTCAASASGPAGRPRGIPQRERKRGGARCALR